MKFVVASLLALAATTAFSQVPVRLSFKFMCSGNYIDFDATQTALNGGKFKVDDVFFYVSKVKVVHDGGQETAIDSVYLFSNQNPEIVLETMDLTAIEGIKFMVGVPEELNHLDISQYPADHPLSFQKAPMHWGWTAGYVHFLMDGHGDTNGDGIPEPANYYQHHCLGDENTKFVDVSTIANTYPDNSREIVLFVNLDQWLEGSDPATTGSVHSSEGINIEIMNNVDENPVFVAPQNAGVGELAKALQLNVYQDGNDVQVNWDKNIAASSYELVGADGRVADSGTCGKSSLAFTDMKPGLHLLRIFDSGHQSLGAAKWIVP